MSEVKNIEGAVRAIDLGNGVCELVKEPDVLCVIPIKKKTRKALTVLGTAGIIGGAVVAVTCLAPPIGTILFALIAWCLYAAKEMDERR